MRTVGNPQWGMSSLVGNQSYTINGVVQPAPTAVRLVDVRLDVPQVFTLKCGFTYAGTIPTVLQTDPPSLRASPYLQFVVHAGSGGASTEQIAYGGDYQVSGDSVQVTARITPASLSLFTPAQTLGIFASAMLSLGAPGYLPPPLGSSVVDWTLTQLNTVGTQVLQPSVMRKGFTVYNGTGTAINLRLGESSSGVVTSPTVVVPASGGYYESPFGYTGPVCLYSAATGSSTVQVTELF